MTEVKSGLNVSNELKKIIEIVEKNKKGKGNKKQEKDRKEEIDKKIDKKEEKKEEKREIDDNYDRLINEVIKDIEKGILNLNLEEYIKPGGICEGIAGAVGYIGKLKRSQLRKFFNEIKTIEYDLKSGEDVKKIKIRILALIPKLAYSKGRDLIDENFYEFMKTILSKVKEDMNEENAQVVFEVFVKILESIVAYHTYHFPKEA